MSVVSKIIRCDWPGCEKVVVIGEGQLSLSDSGWESRIGTCHVCPEHRFHTSVELSDALDKTIDTAEEEVRMSEEQKQPACRVCGKPATNYSRDILVSYDWDLDREVWEPGGLLRLGCDEHQAEPQRIDLTSMPR